MINKSERTIWNQIRIKNDWWCWYRKLHHTIFHNAKDTHIKYAHVVWNWLFVSVGCLHGKHVYQVLFVKNDVFLTDLSLKTIESALFLEEHITSKCCGEADFAISYSSSEFLFLKWIFVSQRCFDWHKINNQNFKMLTFQLLIIVYSISGRYAYRDDAKEYPYESNINSTQINSDGVPGK